MTEKKHKFNETVETQLAGIVFNEYTISKQNRSHDMTDFEACVDLFDNERYEKEYDWQSDIPIPEFSSQMLTQISLDVAQYFQTRDFVETYIQDASDEALLAADAAEELLNRTLNRKDLYHYHKFVRAKSLSNIGGEAYAECGWEQFLGDDGTVKKDGFWYDILDPRNIFTDNKYCYSLQQKDYVIIRSERTLQKLRQESERSGYFNLDLLKDMKADSDTETKRETTDRDSGTTQTPENKITENFDILKRYGTYWIDDDGKPGIDENGEIKEGAELKEVIITLAINKGMKILIGFHETPYIDAQRNPFRPIIRGLCYIHPTRDKGVGDGHYARPLAIAINDTFNVSNDRTMLATMPTMKGKKFVTDDTDSVFMAPGHLIELNEPDDLQEVQISDNIQGAMAQIGLLINKMQQTTSIYPTTMGTVPTDSSTTATAVQGANMRSNQRSNYKSLTFEYTFLNELYWMIQQMTWEFAKPETGLKLMGDKVFNFNPALDFFYKPLSQSIETEEAKTAKVRQWTAILQIITSSNHPNMPAIFNYIILKIVMLMGDEFSNFSGKFLNPEIPLQEGEQGSVEGSEQRGEGPSNQQMIPQGQQEISTRENAGAMNVQ